MVYLSGRFSGASFNGYSLLLGAQEASFWCYSPLFPGLGRLRGPLFTVIPGLGRLIDLFTRFTVGFIPSPETSYTRFTVGFIPSPEASLPPVSLLGLYPA